MDAEREPRHRPDVSRVLVLSLLLVSLPILARAQVGTENVIPPPPGTAQEPPPASPVLDEPPEFAGEPTAVPDPVSDYRDTDQEFYDFDAERDARRVAQHPPQPPAPLGSEPLDTERPPAFAIRGYQPTGNVHHTLAVHFGTMGRWADRPGPILRLGALYLIDIRPSEDALYRMRLGVGIHLDVASTVVLAYYARLLPLGLDLGHIVVLRLGADVGVAHLVGTDVQFMVGPTMELGLALDDGHVEVAMQAGVPVLVGIGSTELWTLNLLLAYLF